MPLKQTIQDLINNNIRNKFPKVIKSEHADIEDAILGVIFIPYQVFQIDCPQQFALDNFDWSPGPEKGLGINEMVGFAVSNGNNGTINRSGRTAIQYDPVNYPVMGALGGAKEHTLTINEMPAHTHSIILVDESGNGAPSGGTPGGESNGTGATESRGGGLAHNNMQPYVVSLFIQRV